LLLVIGAGAHNLAIREVGNTVGSEPSGLVGVGGSVLGPGGVAKIGANVGNLVGLGAGVLGPDGIANVNGHVLGLPIGVNVGGPGWGGDPGHRGHPGYPSGARPGQRPPAQPIALPVEAYLERLQEVSHGEGREHR